MPEDNRSSRSEPHQRTEVEGLKVVVHDLRPQLVKNSRRWLAASHSITQITTEHGVCPGSISEGAMSRVQGERWLCAERTVSKRYTKRRKTTVTTVALFQGPGRPVAGSLTGNTKHGTNLKRKSQYCSIEPDLSHTPVAQMEDQAGTVAQIDLRLR